MKNKKKQIRKELNQKLVIGALIHLSDLKKQKRQKLNRYLERKMGSITEYYLNLLNKQKIKSPAVPAAGNLSVTTPSEAISKESTT